MTEKHKHKAYKGIAKRYLQGRGFSEDEVFEEYPVTFDLTEQEREYFARTEADEKWGRHLGIGHEQLDDNIKELREHAYERTYRLLRNPVTFRVDVVGVSGDDSRKIAIECGKVRPTVRLEILRKEFHEVIRIPPIPFDMLPFINMDEFSGKG